MLAALAKLTSCKKITTDWETFTIKKGKHRSTRALNYSKQTTFDWSVEFDSSAIYSTKDRIKELRDISRGDELSFPLPTDEYDDGFNL